MRVKMLMTFLLAALCMPPIFNPILVLASSLSASFISLDSSVGNSRGWDNAWTETVFGNGIPPFKTIAYSRPQVTWNGTQWVKYEISPVNETAVILRTPTCAYLVEKSVVSLLDPNGTSHVGGMRWDVEQYSVTLNKWLPKSVETASVSHNGTHVWQKWTYSDKSERILYIGHDNKQTVTFTSKTSATYRVSWRFTDINATRISYSEGRQDKLEAGGKVSLPDFNSSQLALYDQNKFSLSVRYNDIDPSYYRGFTLESSEKGSAHLNLIYGNWTPNFNESIVVDPETETFNSEAAIDGSILKYGTSYPPEDETSVNTDGITMSIGQDREKDTTGPGFEFYLDRGYVSFDTSSVRDYAVITNATLKLKTYMDYSATDFIMRVMGGSQPIYGSSLEAADWNCSTTEVATWSTSEYPGDDIYVNITIPTDQISVTERTQFELKSNREATCPTGDEFIHFCSGDYGGSEPKLEITWQPQEKYVDGQWWYYWNSTTNEKAAIVLFGGQVYSTNSVLVKSLFIQNPWPYYKEKFVQDLHSNGFDVLSPKNDTVREERSHYTGTRDWVENASVWLVEKGYQYVFLFGFSAGGVVAAYEIQKDYATIFSAAVVADAPVDYDTLGEIFNSADTASEVKVCTSFIVGENDMALGNITEQMKHYYDNTVVHKEWHLWEDGHDPFPNHCLTHPDPPETVFDVTYNWYQHTHSLTISAESGGTTNPTPGTYTHSCGESVTVTATPYASYDFDYWILDGATVYDNPITAYMNSDHTLEAHFKYSGGGGCPTLFVWNGTAYIEEGALDIHADSDVTVQHRIQNTLALENGVYNLQLRELDNYTSHIDQVKLYAVDYEGEWHLCPLIYAKTNGSHVTWKLLFDDEKRIDLTPTQIVNLKFLRSIPYSQTAYFIFEINGYNPKGNGFPK